VDTLALAVANLTSIPVLVFLAAVLISRFSPELKLPDAIYQFLAVFLLLGIGIKGGNAIKSAEGAELLWPAVAAFGLGIVIPLIAYGLLRIRRRFSQVDAGSLAAHYGSTSLVTFAAALVMLESLSIFVEPYTAALLAIMEVPGIVMGVYLGTRRPRVRRTAGAAVAPPVDDADSRPATRAETFKEILLAKTVFFLILGLVVGVVAPEESFIKVEPFFVGLQPGILVLFLLQLGLMVGSRLGALRQGGLWLPVFAVVMPLIAGTIGAFTGVALGMSVGGATMLAVLCASASYIAAPAAVSLAMPKANLTLALAATLGITFPFNLLFGLPIYVALAEFFAGVLGAG